jgi:hypothetical protein
VAQLRLGRRLVRLGDAVLELVERQTSVTAVTGQRPDDLVSFVRDDPHVKVIMTR